MNDKPQTRTELYVAVAMLLFPELQGMLDDATTAGIIDTIRQAHGQHWAYVAGTVYVAGRCAIKFAREWRGQ